MDIHEHGNMLLQSIAHVLQVKNKDKTAMVFDQNNECFLTFDEKIVLMFYLDDEINAIIINTLLGVLPQNDSREEMMFELLSANYCWNMSEGGTLGIDKETAVISLGYLVELPMNSLPMFEGIINKLVNVSDFWIRKLKEIGHAYEGSDNPSDLKNHFMRV